MKMRMLKKGDKIACISKKGIETILTVTNTDKYIARTDSPIYSFRRKFNVSWELFNIPNGIRSDELRFELIEDEKLLEQYKAEIKEYYRIKKIINLKKLK